MRYLSKLRVNLKLLGSNLSEIHSLVGHQKKIMPMLKAEAYGHGAIPVAEYYLDNFSSSNILEGFGLATVYEAYALRSKLKNCSVPLYVFSELGLREKSEWYEQWGLIPVLSNLSDLNFFLTEKSFSHLPLVLKFNSGMNRLGFKESEVATVQQVLKQHQRRTIFHLMSHFAFSYVYSHPSIQQQIAVMERIKNNFAKAQIAIEHYSMANSGAIEQQIEIPHSTVVRPGLMLYGPKSVEASKSQWKGKVVSSLQTTVLTTTMLREGEAFGYGLTQAPSDGVLIVLPLGYADGMQFGFNGFNFLIDTVQVKFLARPNMDLCYLWTTDQQCLKWKDKKIQIWNAANDNLQLLSDHNQTITYQILTAISSRVPRDYVLE